MKTTRIKWAGGKFRNIEEGKGWKRVGHKDREGYWRIEMPVDRMDRLTYVCRNGILVQTPEVFKWDGASVPDCVGWLVGRWEFEHFSLFHDASCEHEWLWVSYDDGATWEPYVIGRRERDGASRDGWIPADGGAWFSRYRRWWWLRAYAYGTFQWD